MSPPVPRETGAPGAEQAATKQDAVEARTSVGEALTKSGCWPTPPHVLALADRVVDVAFTLHSVSPKG